MRPGLAVAVLALLAVAGCGGNKTIETAAPTPSKARLVVQNYTFPPLEVAAGVQIELVNMDAEDHTVTADGGSFNSGHFRKSQPGSITAPATPGAYPYHCEVHPTLHGAFTVK